MTEAGWYPDPQVAGAVAYWDGVQWTGHRQPAAPVRRRGRRGLLLAGAAVVVAAAVTATVLLWPGDDAPTLTYGGRKLVDAAGTLSRAEAAVAIEVKRRQGASSGDSRCYFARSHAARSTDVDHTLYCGPLLFFGGSTRREYLPLALANPLTAARPQLDAVTVPATAQTVALPPGKDLLRPDGRRVPGDDGGLRVPAPAPAERDVVLSADLDPGQQPRTLAGARMVGDRSGVQVTAAGYVQYYGRDAGARSAPTGQRLLAFQLTGLDGERGGADPDLRLHVSGVGTDRPVQVGADGSYLVAAVPRGAAVSLELTDGGLTQSLALPAGRPGPHNLAVLARENRTTSLQRTISTSLRFSARGTSATVDVKAVAGSARLDYWSPVDPTAHASGPQRALLSVSLTYSDPNRPGRRYGFEPGMLHLDLPDGTRLTARNISTDHRYLDDVFDVPASLTRATLRISGSITRAGVLATVLTPAEVDLSFPSG